MSAWLDSFPEKPTNQLANNKNTPMCTKFIQVLFCNYFVDIYQIKN